MFQNKLHNSIDPNTLSIYPLFEASKRGKTNLTHFNASLKGLTSEGSV